MSSAITKRPATAMASHALLARCINSTVAAGAPNAAAATDQAMPHLAHRHAEIKRQMTVGEAAAPAVVAYPTTDSAGCAADARIHPNLPGSLIVVALNHGAAFVRMAADAGIDKVEIPHAAQSHSGVLPTAGDTRRAPTKNESEL